MGSIFFFTLTAYLRIKLLVVYNNKIIIILIMTADFYVIYSLITLLTQLSKCDKEIFHILFWFKLAILLSIKVYSMIGVTKTEIINWKSQQF
jgi:hypothetical protein